MSFDPINRVGARNDYYLDRAPPLRSPAPARQPANWIDNHEDGGCCDCYGTLRAIGNYLRDLWHTILRYFGLEDPVEPSLQEPLIRLNLPPVPPANNLDDPDLARAIELSRQEPQKPRQDNGESQLLKDLEKAIALSAQEPQKPRPRPLELPKHFLPTVAPYQVPEHFLFSNEAELLRATQEYFADHATPPRLDLPNLSEWVPIAEVFEVLLQKYEGICIAEDHAHSAPKYLLCHYMPLLVKLGVDTLYIEGYPHQDFQADFDAYFKPSTSALQIPEKLANKLKRMEIVQQNASAYTEKDVITAAKNAGIRRVICIDTTASQNTAPRLKQQDKEIYGVARTAVMNYQAKCIIDHTMGQNGGKSIIWAGLLHIARGGGVPSMEQLYGFPSIYIVDKPEVETIIPQNGKIDPDSLCKLEVGKQHKCPLSNRMLEYDLKISMPIPCKFNRSTSKPQEKS